VQWREDLMNGKNEALLAAAAESRFNSHQRQPGFAKDRKRSGDG